MTSFNNTNVTMWLKYITLQIMVFQITGNLIVVSIDCLGWQHKNIKVQHNRAFQALTARDCPKWPSGKSICVLSCPPNLDGWTFGQPIFSVPNYRSSSTRGALYFEWFHKLIFVLNNRDLYQFCPWSHIQLIVYLDNIISIALIPVLKYWWRRANNTAASQVVIKGVLLHFSITSSVIRDKVHHCEIPNALAMKIQQSCN